jgi:hypothetical protein
MGFVGFFVKLVHIPINNIIMGGMWCDVMWYSFHHILVHNRQLCWFMVIVVARACWYLYVLYNKTTIIIIDILFVYE